MNAFIYLFISKFYIFLQLIFFNFIFIKTKIFYLNLIFFYILSFNHLYLMNINDFLYVKLFFNQNFYLQLNNFLNTENLFKLNVIVLLLFRFRSFFLNKIYVIFNIVNSCNILKVYKYFTFSNYDLLYQNWYKYARNQKNTYLAAKYRLVYLTKTQVNKDLSNEEFHQEYIHEYFILKKKNFFDDYAKPTKIKKYISFYHLRRKFYSIQRRKNSLKGILFFYLKDYETRINNKEQQQKTLRIYEGLFGTYIYQELLKKGDQKQAKFVSVKLTRN